MFHQYHIISTGAADENNSKFKAKLWHIVPKKAKRERVSSCSSGTAADASTGLQKDVGIQRGTTTVGVHTFKLHPDSQPDTPFLRFQDEHGHELGAIAQNSTGTTRATRERKKLGPGGGGGMGWGVHAQTILHSAQRNLETFCYYGFLVTLSEFRCILNNAYRNGSAHQERRFCGKF